MNDPTRRDQSPEIDDLQQALNAAYLPRWLSSVLALIFYGFLLVKPEITAAVLGLHSAGFGNILLWVGGLFLALMPGAMICSTYIGPVLFHRFTGIYYRQDRLSYARAGGFDVNGMAGIGSQILMFGVWWAIPAQTSLNAARSGWGFILLSLLLSIGMASFIYSILFIRHGRR